MRADFQPLIADTQKNSPILQRVILIRLIREQLKTAENIRAKNEIYSQYILDRINI